MDAMTGRVVPPRFKAGRYGTLWYYRELLGTFRTRLGAVVLFLN